MKLNKAEKRDKKNFKKKHGMRINGKSVFVIGQAIKTRSAQLKAKKESNGKN